MLSPKAGMTGVNFVTMIAESIECAMAVLDVEGRSAHEIFGSPDDWKLRSCATLFALASAPESVFSRLLAKYFDGRQDEQTVRLLSRA